MSCVLKNACSTHPKWVNWVFQYVLKANHIGKHTKYWPNEGLVMEVPHSDVSIRAAGEADLGVRAYGQCVAGRSRGSELGLYARRLWGQVPDGQRAGFATHYQGAAVRQQLAGADVIVPVLEQKQVSSRYWCNWSVNVKYNNSNTFLFDAAFQDTHSYLTVDKNTLIQTMLWNIYVNRVIWG